jgi:hypothetical protein
MTWLNLWLAVLLRFSETEGSSPDALKIALEAGGLSLPVTVSFVDFSLVGLLASSDDGFDE